MDSIVKKPIVTVLMPVYNGEKYLREAMNSILCQTFADFDFLIIEDGSTDGSVDIIKSYDDKRIKILINEKNLGVSKTSNIGIEHTNTKYIARMDCDDISLPNRLEEQILFMEAHPNIGVCGTWMETFTGTSQPRLKKLPVKNDDMVTTLLFRSPIAQPTVMMRKDVLDKYRLRYDETYEAAEDYDLWERMSRVTQIENIPRALLRYRLHPQQLGRTSNAAQKGVEQIQKRQYERLGIEKGDLAALLAANRKQHLYNDWSLKKHVYRIYYTNFKSLIKKLIRW